MADKTTGEIKEKINQMRELLGMFPSTLSELVAEKELNAELNRLTTVWYDQQPFWKRPFSLFGAIPPEIPQPTEPEAPTQLWQLSDEQLGERFTDLSKEPYPPPQGRNWEVVSFDAQGLPAEPHWELTSVEETSELPFDPLAMTDMQRGQLDLSERQFAQRQAEFDWRKQQSADELGFQQMQSRDERSRQQQQGNLMTQLTQQRQIEAQFGRDTGVSERDFNIKQAEQFELWRERFQAELQGQPSRWLEREALQFQPNPFEQDPETQTEYLASLEAQEKQLEKAVKEADKIEKTYTVPAAAGASGARSVFGNTVQEQVSPGQVPGAVPQGIRDRSEIARTWLNSVRERIEDVELSAAFREEQRRARPGDFDTGEPQISGPRGVKTPAWLAQAVPGLGEFIPRTGNIGGAPPPGEIPSPQQWRGLGSSRQQELGAYWRFAGQDPQDLVSSMERMKPQSLRLGRTFRAAQQV